MSALTGLIRSTAKRAGFLLDYRTLQTDDDLRLAYMLNQAGVGTVLDVGANEGQFAQALFASGFEGEVISFEPLPSAHARLTASAARNPRWTAWPRAAVSDKAGVAVLHEGQQSYASSLLPFNKSLSETIPAVADHEVPTIRLDDLDLPDRLFLKMDTQGSEWAILHGAEQTLKRTLGVHVEMAIDPVYEGQRLDAEVSAFLIERGFRLWDTIAAYREPITQRLLYYDGVYLRAEQ